MTRFDHKSILNSQAKFSGRLQPKKSTIWYFHAKRVEDNVAMEIEEAHDIPMKSKYAYIMPV